MVMSIIKRVDEQVDLRSVANRYRLGWPDRGDKPIQISCPMHADATPSARYYPRSNSAYCWTCQKSFGPTGLVVALEGLSWGRAIALLVSWYHVDLSVDPDEEEARRLIDLANAGPGQRCSDEDMRRAAGMSLRAVGRPAEMLPELLDLYEMLDLTDIGAEAWLNEASSLLTARAVG